MYFSGKIDTIISIIQIKMSITIQPFGNKKSIPYLESKYIDFKDAYDESLSYRNCLF